MIRVLGVLIVLWPLLGTPGIAAPRQESEDRAPQVRDRIARIVQELVDTLDPSEKTRILRPFESGERRKWSYLPGPRPGFPLAEMTARQRRLTHRLLRSFLDARGYLKVTGVMKLEEVLRAVETRGFLRSSGAYYLVLFGLPGDSDPWGLRFEGHHVSIHFTALPGRGSAHTPLFLGANPGEVRKGTWAGYRVLSGEEDLARSLLLSLDEDQRSRAVVAQEAPRDIRTRMDPGAKKLAPEGLPAADMTPDQRNLLERLVEEYVGDLAPGLAEVELRRLHRTELEDLAFAWAGGAEPGEPHYYRIQGDTLLIEYDNTQNDANHVHTVWRDLERDFGGDLLRDHYRKGAHAHEEGGHPPRTRHRHDELESRATPSRQKENHK